MKILCKIVKIHPKLVKNHYIKKRRQRWLSPNNRISSDGNLCPKKLVLHRFEKETIAIAAGRNLTIAQV